MNISGSITYADEGRPLEQGFYDGFGNPADGSHAIFPIIQTTNDEAWKPIATGFFISNNGLFATAKHVVIDDSTGELYDSLAGVQLIRSQNRIVIREAIKMVVHPTGDVAVGFLVDTGFLDNGVQTVNKCFAITESIPKEGCKIASYAFPKSESIKTKEGFIMNCTLTPITGILEYYHANGGDRTLLPGKCFRTSMNLKSGASGGPVAAISGQVFGINSTGWDASEMSYVSSIKDILDLEIHNVRLPDGVIYDHIDLRQVASHGLIKIAELS